MVGEPDSIRVLDATVMGAVASPIRRAMLDELVEPDSATRLAKRLDSTRQKMNYHLRELEKGGLVELVEERRRRGFIERMFRATARAFVVDPGLLGTLGRDRDRFSSAWLLSTAARLIRDVAVLRRRASRAGKKLLTQTIETEARFRRPADLEAFTDDLARELVRLIQKHGAKKKERARRFRLVFMGHPALAREEET